MVTSRLSGFYRLSGQDRLRILVEKNILSATDRDALLAGRFRLTDRDADKMVENVIGVFGLPMGLGLNFVINDVERIIPMVVEEPSIIAAISSAALAARAGGGFRCIPAESVLLGQVQITQVPSITKARQAVMAARQTILELANSLHPRMVARGGGALDVEVVRHRAPTTKAEMLVIHLVVNTCDAMGANMVNSMCEEVAPLLEELTGGKAFLRILSNLADRALACAEVVFSLRSLEGKGYSGEEVCDGVILANDFAAVDPYRAATHNKGIMNGIDAVAIATGNDWRSMEAGAHAYAARTGSYTSLTQWWKDAEGNLRGRLKMPIKVGVVGGNLQSNPMVALAHRILGTPSAAQLSEVMVAAGLAQNFSALRALVTDGIQRGHMNLHARSVAASAGASSAIFEQVVKSLVASGEVKMWKAQEIIRELTTYDTEPQVAFSPECTGAGKVILLGEHAVVYGTHAIAAPVPLAVGARVLASDTPGIRLVIPTWGVERVVRKQANASSLEDCLSVILDDLGLNDRDMIIRIDPQIPRAAGLGSSAALAVAVVRALDTYFALGLSNERVNALAYASETIAHGTASGIDNTMATYGRLMMFQKGEAPIITNIALGEPLPLVIGMTGVQSLTAKMVARVRAGFDASPHLYQRIFQDIDTLVLAGAEALKKGDWQELGLLFNLNHGLLNALQVSCPELEMLVDLARNHGATGAKLTGGGGGGSMIAVCPEGTSSVARAIRDAGFQAIEIEIGADI